MATMTTMGAAVQTIQHPMLFTAQVQGALLFCSNRACHTTTADFV
jgi:hypothetical protein